MVRILKYFGFKVENTEEYKLLKLKNEVLEMALRDAQGQLESLGRENQGLRDRLTVNIKKEEEALQRLFDELDILALEQMEPVGDA